MLSSQKRLTVLKMCAIVFIALELVLFPLIQFTPADTSAVASYIAIVLVAICAFLTVGMEEGGKYIRLGFIGTLVADYFLVLCDDAQLEGVVAFIFVQLAYCVYLLAKEERSRVSYANVLSRIGLTAVLMVCAMIILGTDTDMLVIASVIYYANLVVNAVFAFFLGKKERIFAIGLVLFAMCDLCIGLEVLFDTYLSSDALGFFYGAYINLPWIFYQPSQVLIALRLYHPVYTQN